MLSDREIDELKARLVAHPETAEQDFLRLQARCVRAFGPPAGIFMRNVVFWTGKSALEGGWIWKTEAEMEAETGLGRSHQRKARTVLVSRGVLEEDRRGVPRRLHYRANLTKLLDILEPGCSTLNQWRRGLRKDADTGEFYRPEPATLNPRYSEEGITNLASQEGTTDPASEEGNTNLASQEGTTVLAIQREPQRDAQKIPSEDSDLQSGSTGSKTRRHEPECKEDQEHPNPAGSTRFDPTTDFEYADVLRLIGEPGPVSDLAHRHRKGDVAFDDLAEAVGVALWGRAGQGVLYRSRVAQALEESKAEQVAV